MAEEALTESDEDEQWRPIPDHPKYELSNLGRIRSWKGWLGTDNTFPRTLKVQEKSGRRWIQLGLHGGRHYIDDLMHEVWGDPEHVPAQGEPMLWRRLMLSERQHATLVAILELIDSPPANKLLVAARTSKRVRWDDPILHEELPTPEDT